MSAQAAETKAKLTAEMCAFLANVEAKAPEFAGMFVIALVPTDGSAPHHYEDAKGVVRFLRFDSAQRYTRFDFANRRRSDILRGRTLPEGYTMEVLKGEDVIARVMAETKSVIAYLEQA